MSHRPNLAWMLGLALLASTAAASPARQEAPAGETRVTVADGIVLGLSMSGVSSTSALVARVRVRDGEVYRLVVDATGLARFAYAIRLDPVGTGVEVVFRPVRLHEALRAFAPQQPTYTLPFRLDALVTLPDIQRSGAVAVGDDVALDLFDNRDTGQRIGDRVRMLAIDPRAIGQLAATRRAAIEARPELTLAGMTIRRGGQIIRHGKPGNLATGYAVGLGLGNGAGTAVFSAEAPGSAVPEGVALVDGATIRFTVDGHEYECSGTDPIGPPGLTSVWLYVMREPPPFGDGFLLSASDSVDGLFKMWRRRTR
jgi:hypothetical protein